MIAHVDNRITYNGNGNATEFAYQFKILDRTDIKVMLAKPDGSTQILSKDYYVDVEKSVVIYPGYAPGAEIPESERPPVLPAGWRLVLYREVPITQLVRLPEIWPFNVIEAMADKLTIICQQLKDKLSRALTINESSASNIDTTVPWVPGKTFRVSDDGTHLQATEAPGKVIDEAKGLLAETTIKAEETATNAQEAKQANAEIKTIYNNGSFTPITDLMGSIGTAIKRWGYIFANKVFAMNLPIVYKSVAEMKADSLLFAGMTACTLGYYSPNDGGAGTYIIRAKADGDVDDGGSLHELANGNVAELVVENGTVNVKQFGAKGDWVTDDTERVKIAIKYHVDKRYKLMFVGTFFVTDSLMNKEDYTDEVYINFEGITPLQAATYSGRNDSVILFKNGISLFQGITLKGSIYRMTFVPQSRSTTGCIFKNCNLASFCFMYNCVSNILAFCLDTALSSTSKIAYNKFLTVYYFAKIETSSATCTDSIICYNYINGGMELNDNACFQWCFFNGSTVSHNFIDYYRAIYEPKANRAFYFQGPMSSMNQYQVFRYLYLQGEASSIVFCSCGDIINWTDISKLEKLSRFVPIMYKDKNDIEHEMPPYTIQVNAMNNIVFNSLYIQNNVSDLIFIMTGLSVYKNAGCIVRDLTIVGYTTSGGLYDKYVNQADEIFIGGQYKNNMVDIPFIKTLDELPTVSAIRGAYYPGEKVKVGNNCYKLVYSDVDNTGTAKYHWVPIYTRNYE